MGFVQDDQEISAYAYERTLKLAERVQLLKDLKLANKELQLQVGEEDVCERFIQSFSSRLLVLNDEQAK